jgi:hypothetical protein
VRDARPRRRPVLPDMRDEAEGTSVKGGDIIRI